MDDATSALNQLSQEQLAALSDELKTLYCSMDPSDQAFYAATFKPKDLPNVLAKKGELMQRNQAEAERLALLRGKLAASRPAGSSSTPGSTAGEDILTTAVTALGLGGAAVLVATDNEAHYQGVMPQELVAPLRVEFQNDTTRFTTSGAPDGLIGTVSLVADDQDLVPAMTINLTAINGGTDVKVNELSSQGILESIKSSGKKLLALAGQGLNLLWRKQRGGLSPEAILSAANQSMDTGASLVEGISNLKLKERAWKVIRQTAEPLEAQYLAEKEQAIQRRLALEKAWDSYYACPTCGVTFSSDEEQTCRVCGSARPQAPQKPDPRKIA